MLKTQFFSPPDGDFIVNPKLKLLKNLIINKGESYWNAGAGQGCLTCEEDGNTVQLTISYISGFGFYLEFIDSEDVYFVSIGEGTFNETVTVEVGGDRLLLPTAFLISKELAWSAVEVFCKTGQRTNKINWKKRSDVDWDYGFPEE